jgi:hypothetical protein
MAIKDDIENFTTTVEDAVSYPILTRDTSDYPYSRNGSSSSTSGNGVTSITRTAKQTIRDVLGWRYRTDDAKGFLAALNKSFSLKEVEGHIEWEWKAQSYMVQADMGEITGAQASVYKQATVLLENALPLLDGVTPLRTDADAEDTEAMRAIVRTEMTELVGELGIIGGPRVQRVDSFFEKLIGPLLPMPSFDPEHVKGQLARLRQRFGLTRARVNTITEEQNLTNFLILVDYVNSLYQSWNSKRAFFNGTAEPFLGTQLVLLSELLDAILEQLQETYDAMDSVFFGPAERQTTEIPLADGPMTVTEILSWVENFAAVEGRQLIQEGGKDGVVVFNSTMVRLRDIVQEAADIAAQPSSNPVRPFHTKRVALALGELGSYLSSAVDRATEIRRRVLEVPEHLGEEQNVLIRSALIPPKLVMRIDRVDWIALKRGAGDWSPRKPGDEIGGGDRVKVALWGFFPHLPVAISFDDEISVRRIQDASKTKIVVVVEVENDADTGWHSVTVEDRERQKRRVREALYVAEQIQEPQPGLIDADFHPRCGHQGESMHVQFDGDDLGGAAVSFGTGNDIQVKSTTYTAAGIDVKITIHPRARIGHHKVTVFTTTASKTLDHKFQVLAAATTPLFAVETTPLTRQADECPDETTVENTTTAATSPPRPSQTPTAPPAPSAMDTPTVPATPTPAPAATSAADEEESVPGFIRSAVDAANIKVADVTDYRPQFWEPHALEKGRDRKLEAVLEKDQPLESAWLVSKSAPYNVIKCVKKEHKHKKVTMLFDSTVPARGYYYLVMVLNDKSVEYVEDAVNFK